MRLYCLAKPSIVRASSVVCSSSPSDLDPRAEKTARLNALKERLRLLEKKLAEKVIARPVH